MRAVLISCMLSVATIASAADPYLVTDLRTLPTEGVSSSPELLGAIGNIALFDTLAGLWRSDGTAAGTTLLSSGTIWKGFQTDGLVYFTRLEQPGSWRIWKSDGTVAGTQPVTPAFSRFPWAVALRGNRLLFISAGIFPWELWSYDGSQAQRIATIDGFSAIRFVTTAPFGNDVAIVTDRGVWRTDGTTSGTAYLGFAVAWNGVVDGNALYYVDQSQHVLWKSDGTPAGTQSTGLSASDVAVVNGSVVLRVSGGGISTTDGTTAGTHDLVAGRPCGGSDLARMGAAVYFSFDDGHGCSLWRTDGTVAGTRAIHALPPVSMFFAGVGATRLYLVANLTLFVSDGTSAGTAEVGPIPFYDGFLTAGDRLFFSGHDVFGSEPWTSDGTAAGTHMIANLGKETQPGSSEPVNLVAGDRLFFVATDDAQQGLFSTDGTSAGTRVAMVPSSAGLAALAAVGDTAIFQLGQRFLGRSGPERGSDVQLPSLFIDKRTLRTIDGQLYFVANGAEPNEFADYELWTVNATSATAVKLTDLDHDEPTAVTELAGKVYFLSRHGVLYSVGTTAAETRRIAAANAVDDLVTPLVAFKGALYAVTRSSASGSKLVRFSGSPADVTTVKSLDDSYASEIAVAAGDFLYFVLHPASSGAAQLYRTDGTEAGTSLIAPFAPAATITSAAALGQRLLYVVDGHVAATDGSTSGTGALPAETTTIGQLPPARFAVADGVAYFRGYDTEHGLELWRTDATATGTARFADVAAGTASADPEDIVRFGDALYFAATTAETGRELWAAPLPKDVAIVVDDARVREGAGSADVRVHLTRAASTTVNVSYQTVDNSATAGRDYTSTSGTLVFSPGSRRRR